MITGYGLIDSNGKQSTVVSYGAIRTGSANFTDRLAVIAKQLHQIIQEFQPQQAAIENVFLGNNAASALKLGQAKGVAIGACALNSIAVTEYATRLVKQTVVGTGSASKRQVQHMLMQLFTIRQALQADAADALAVAVCHAHSQLNTHSLPVKTKAKRSLRFTEAMLQKRKSKV